MRKIVKIIIAALVLSVVATGIGFVVFYTSQKANDCQEMLITSDINIDSGIATPKFTTSEFNIPKKGDYSFNMEWESENPGVLTGIVVTDATGAVTFAATAESCIIESEIIHLDAGKYCLTYQLITNTEEFNQFIEDNIFTNKEVSDIEDGQTEEYSTEDYQFTDSVNQQTTYRFSVVTRNMYTVGRRYGMVCGVFIAVFLIYVFYVVTRKDNTLKNKYDERQEVIRGRGYKYGFISFFAYCGLALLLDIAEISIPAQPAVIYFIGIAISIAIYACYCIWNDGYYAINERKSVIMICLLGVGLLNVAVSVINIFGGKMIENGELTFRSLNLLCGFLLFIILAVTYLKGWKDRRESDHEEPEA